MIFAVYAARRVHKTQTQQQHEEQEQHQQQGNNIYILSSF